MSAQLNYSFTFITTMIILCAQACSAETLQGQVELNASPMRLSRQSLGSQAERNLEPGNVQQWQPSTNASNFASAPTQSPPTVNLAGLAADQAKLDQTAERLLKSFANTISGGITRTHPVASPAMGPAPYVWSQSMQGGYHDASGTISENVNANQLYRYGGKFTDGTAVPKDPITHQNAFGHAYKQGNLSSGIFWDH